MIRMNKKEIDGEVLDQGVILHVRQELGRVENHLEIHYTGNKVVLELEKLNSQDSNRRNKVHLKKRELR